jgi:hypothetical protein
VVGIEGVVKRVGWPDVVDGVGFFATDAAAWVVGEESFALALEVCCCSGFGVLVGGHVGCAFFVLFSSALVLAHCGCFRVSPRGPTLGTPHGSPVVTDWSPSLLRTDTIRVYVVRTLLKRLTLAPIQVSHPKIRGAFVYPRSRVFYQLSAIPNVGVVVICFEKVGEPFAMGLCATNEMTEARTPPCEDY